MEVPRDSPPPRPGCRPPRRAPPPPGGGAGGGRGGRGGRGRGGGAGAGGPGGWGGGVYARVGHVRGAPSADRVGRRSRNLADRDDALPGDAEIGDDRRSTGAVDHAAVPDRDVDAHAAPRSVAVATSSTRPGSSTMTTPYSSRATCTLTFPASTSSST